MESKNKFFRNMSIILIAFLRVTRIIAFFVLITLVQLPSISFAEPNIIFDEESHDFGIVTKKDIIEYAFEFENKGDEELIINQIVPS